MRCCGVHNDNAFSSRVSAAIAKLEAEGQQLSVSTIIEIPVVFHICFPNFVASDVEADVTWSLDQLNKDFNGQADNKNQHDTVFSGDLLTTYNEYKGRMGGMNVNFVRRDVVYRAVLPQSSTNLSILDANIKSHSLAVTPESCLNVWVAQLNSNVLGYAQFPWDFNENTKKFDGVLLARGVFGRNATYTNFRMNKTMTHEVGHWFGLYHTFQNTFAYQGGNIDYAPGENAQESKGDCVIDTPPQAVPTVGNPFQTPDSWPTTTPADESAPARAMFFNFMDYVDDVSMFMYTADQVKKMRLMVQIYRAPLLASPPIVPPPPPPPPVVKSPYYVSNFSDALERPLWTLKPTILAKVTNNILTLINVSSALRSLNLRALSVQPPSSLRAVITYKATAVCSLLVKPPDKKSYSTLTLQPSKTWRTVSLRVVITNYLAGDMQLFLQSNRRNTKLEVQQIRVEL